MGRRALAKSARLLREAKSKQKANHVTVQAKSAESALWVPHPRTGIYYPKGFEWVMEDVPDGAASLRQQYWLRSCETETAAAAAEATDDRAAFDHPFV